MSKKKRNQNKNSNKNKSNKKTSNNKQTKASKGKDKLKGKKAVKPSKKSKQGKSKKAVKEFFDKKRWKTTTDATGKKIKGRKRSKKLSRQTEGNRYQTIIKTLSDYYKKAGSPLKRKELYKKYREIRDEFSNTPLSMLIPNFEKYVIKKQGTRTFPAPLLLGIDWFNFEDIMTAPFSQQFFRSNDIIILDLSCLGMANKKFPYSQIIGQYNKLYNNITFRQAVKQQKSPPPQFVYDSKQSNPKKGIYVFELVDCPPVSGGITTKRKEPTSIGKVIEDKDIMKSGPLGDLLNIKEDRKRIIEKTISDLTEERKTIRNLYAQNKISKIEYDNTIVELDDAISDNLNKLKNL